jgi:hypothetical protein
MEFLGSILHVIHSPFYWRILKKTVLFSGFKKPYNKIRKTRKADKNSSLRRIEFLCSETLTKNAVQEFHLSICTHYKHRAMYW